MKLLKYSWITHIVISMSLTFSGCTSSLPPDNPSSYRERIATKKAILETLKQSQQSKQQALAEVRQKYSLRKKEQDKKDAATEEKIRLLKKQYQQSLSANKRLKQENSELLQALLRNKQEQRKLKSDIAYLKKLQKQSANHSSKAKKYKQEIRALEEKRDALRKQLKVMIEAY